MHLFRSYPMRSMTRLALFALTLPTMAAAQSRTLPEHEIGVRGGWARLSQDDGVGGTDKLSTISIPGALFISPGGLHWTFFLTEKLALEPQFAYIRSSSEGFSSSIMFLALQPELFLGPDARRAPYVFAHFGVMRDTDSGGGTSDTDSQNVFGGGVGYRKVVKKVVATRYELRFRRFGADVPGGAETNEIAILFGLGFVIPRS